MPDDRTRPTGAHQPKLLELPTDPVTVSEVRAIAKTKLDKAVWDYYTTGADQEHALRRNGEIFETLLLRPRVLRDVSSVDTSTRIFGKRYEIPIAIAPTAYQKLAGGNGEIDVARAASAVGTNFILSSNATTSLEDVARALPPRASESALPGPWFQLYITGSRELSAEVIQRAERAGYEALVLTVDTPVTGNRLHERRHPLTLPAGLSMANRKTRSAGGVTPGRLLLQAKTAAEFRALREEYRDTLTDNSLVWEEVIPWLRAQTRMRIILKGITTAEDARLAVEHGVDAVVVSNHGGRQLDGVPSTLESLPEVADAVGGRMPVIFDGGISHGSDVFKALALGADLCLIGRTALWGLAWDGQKGVEAVLNILERELTRTMALMGTARVGEIKRAMLGRARGEGFGIARL